VHLQRRKFLGLVAAGGVASAVRAEPASQAGSAQKPPEVSFGATQHADPWLEISAANLEWNFRQIQTRVGGKRVMAVIKANGYGHGLVGVARVLEKAGVRHFLVAKLEEARELRAAGIRGRILNFGVFANSDAREIVRLRITQNVYTDQVDVLAREAARAQRPARVEIKVDTGLGRFGIPHEQALEFIERKAALRGVQVEGVFTTLTEEPDFDRVQLARLKEICGRATARGMKIGLRHAASSAAIVDFPEAFEQLDMVRPGITLYGLYPSERAEKERKLDLRPVLALKARVAYVKTLRAGESVSYHRAFVAAQPERIATLPVGYSDGFPRALAGKGNVLIAGRRCPIVAMSANATMVRLGDAPAAIGDEAVLIGSQGGATIPASEVARQTGGSVYGVAMGMSALLPAVVI
jgi:alanine racemase